MQRPNPLPASDHFVLHPLTDGVYAAIATDGGAAYSNAGIIDLGDRVLIVDTFDSPHAAKDLLGAAEQLTGRAPSCVIITHPHPDHWMGNQVFDADAPVVATHAARELMPDFAADIQATDPAEFDEAVRHNRAQLETETDPRRRASLERGIVRMQHAAETQPILELRLPDLTFDGRLVFRGPARAAELVALDQVHSPGDAYLALPEERIVFLGDLGFFGCQPYMPYSDPPTWVADSEKWEQSDYAVFVPGHGPLGTKADLALQREYIAALHELVGEVIAAGGAEDDALQISLPEKFEPWLMGGMARFDANARFVYQQSKSKERKG